MALRFVGDLSVEDARVLSTNAYRASVLEFGVGGSTQIFAQQASFVVSVDTDAGWITRTKANLRLLSKTVPVAFHLYNAFEFNGTYDVVFVDGAPSKRLEFAEKAWKCVNPGGSMIFHDTRRFEYFREAAWIAQLHFSEVQNMDVNVMDSNLTVVRKRRTPLHYVNWNYIEGKPLWAYGAEERPEEEGLWEMKD